MDGGRRGGQEALGAVCGFHPRRQQHYTADPPPDPGVAPERQRRHSGGRGAGAGIESPAPGAADCGRHRPEIQV